MTAGKVTHKAVKLVSCSRCGRGKKLRRTMTFTTEVRPGDDPALLLAGLVEDAKYWEPTGTHPPCQCPYFTDQR